MSSYKKAVALLICVGLGAVGVWFADEFIAPLFLNSYVERVNEKGLPKIVIEEGGIIYCRMKADDFRFPLPPGSHAVNPILTFGSFDSVHGTVEAQFESSHQVSSSDYEYWVSRRVQEGSWITAESVPGGLLIKFEYFGDK